jgi:transglutaminase-like putative cysteine protease
MKFKITHTTFYSFDSEVFLEPHYLRFRPKTTAYIDLVDYSIAIVPVPVGHKIIQDEENNVLDFCWFEGMTGQLVVTSTSTIETKTYNPFDFLIFPQHFNQLPLQYDDLQRNLLLASLQGQVLSQELLAYGSTILKVANFNTIPFLTALTQQIHQDFIVEYREIGSPLQPDETFNLKRGSCRDLSWMLIQLLRQLGIAARFVSGYYYFEMDKPAYELHGWVTVFLPGIGWLGLDPSHGIFTGNTHFPIASSTYSHNTMPISGGIRGDATSQLTTQLLIEKI